MQVPGTAAVGKTKAGEISLYFPALCYQWVDVGSKVLRATSKSVLAEDTLPTAAYYR